MLCKDNRSQILNGTFNIDNQKAFESKIFVGTVKRQYGFDTAIDKKSITSPVYLSELGLEGDECADNKHHGGPDRALHQYPAEHYQYWKDVTGVTGVVWAAPGMGENISTQGMTEQNVCIGDRYRFGDAIIEVSQPRSPCFKLNHRWGIERLSVSMQGVSRCGWLFRVIKPGVVGPDALLTLIAREADPLTVKQACDIFFGDPLNNDGLVRLQQITPLSKSWMEKIRLRLDRGEVENWNFRLLGHA